MAHLARGGNGWRSLVGGDRQHKGSEGREEGQQQGLWKGDSDPRNGPPVSAPLLEDLSQLGVWEVLDVQLQKPRPERPGEHLSARVQSRGVLRRKEQEVRVRLDHLLELGHKELPIVIEESVD